ncbi:hypothetical protein [Glaesserella parasuis]|uniref:hypothetical protein n=1 Tax=Glaesserella parasuis TaxID=738 RepID=UPI0024367D1B|nr:hypothetical protein [Glaesserella parasuis]MDG6273406.1 hypothetical protein [Glaesserella parasuis]MDG6277639.1 hypothetical protein [Glaesserella parasuis]MDG6298522.1 hypothetical protein [Glaesserella parasuis]MDG6320110.1 hypothetical protein [Glaesserella parasuis]
MLFTYLFIDNIYNFSNAVIDFTLKRKILHSAIDGEFLDERPNFRFKRVCILSGANASGKTSLGKIMRYIQHFILFPNSNLLKQINDKEKNGLIKVEFVLPENNTIHYLEIVQSIARKSEYPLIKYASIPILDKDTSTSARKRLMEFFAKKGNSNIKNGNYYETEDNNPIFLFDNIRQKIAENLCFYYMFSDNTDKSQLSIQDGHLNAGILETVLKTFDSSIVSVNELRNQDELEGYSIRFSNKDSVLIDKNGDIPNKDRLSKGTFDAIQVADFIAFILQNAEQNKSLKSVCAIYFLDEKMAYSHSEIEQAIVNLISQKMMRYAQFIYTTHNYDVLDLNLPIHSFVFLHKTGDKAEFIQPEQKFKKNDRSLLNYVQNNVFYTIPDTSLLDELL